MKTSYKQSKVVLASRVKNFGLAFVTSKLDKFPHFDNFFPDLADFWNLDNFLDFLAIFSSLPTPNPSTLPSPTLSYLEVNFSGDIIVFSIEVSRVSILLKS